MTFKWALSMKLAHNPIWSAKQIPMEFKGLVLAASLGLPVLEIPKGVAQESSAQAKARALRV